MERRVFLRACAAGAFTAGLSDAEGRALRARFYTRSLLVDEHDRPLRAGALVAGRNYIFHYPFRATPCFLLNLGAPAGERVTLTTEAGGAYEWPGGVGAHRSVVAYSAICSHRLTYPTREISFISYRETGGPASKPRAIHCCSEHSQYDPARGARVLTGPAPEPLAAVLLEHDAASDAIHAVGTLGREMFETFFDKYQMRLELEHGSSRGRAPAPARARVTELSRFCRQQVRC